MVISFILFVYFISLLGQMVVYNQKHKSTIAFNNFTWCSCDEWPTMLSRKEIKDLRQQILEYDILEILQLIAYYIKITHHQKIYTSNTHPIIHTNVNSLIHARTHIYPDNWTSWSGLLIIWTQSSKEVLISVSSVVSYAWY